MSLTLLIVPTAAACAFLMGFSINQGSTCSVTAAKQLVYRRELTTLAGFAVAVGVAGLLCLPLAWLFGDVAHVVHDQGVSVAVLTGAVLLGVGAIINDACLLGTLARIGDGEVRFLGVPVGLAVGFVLMDRLGFVATPATQPNRFAEFDLSGAVVIVVFALLLAVAWRFIGTRGVIVRHHQWPLRTAMIVLGVCGALLFSLTPGWTYADAVRRGVSAGSPMMISFGALVAAVAALLGALVSGIRSQSFAFQMPTALTMVRSVGGGAIMAVGATFVPGGNDALLLASVPAATIGGTAAFAVMSTIVPLLLLARRSLIAAGRNR